MEKLKYKGFIGSIEVELQNNTLYGKILGLDKKTLITYEGNTLEELKKDFKEAVNDYIELCKEESRPLKKSYSGSFNVRIPMEVHAQIAEISQEKGISMNAFISQTLQNAVM